MDLEQDSRPYNGQDGAYKGSLNRQGNSLERRRGREMKGIEEERERNEGY